MILVNKLSDVSALKKLTKLQELWVQYNHISDEDKKSLKEALPRCAVIC